ncbi:hypothetical protein [Streptacidiphilus pinicola]|nr:hypothetical protein [Streptacidiphilus pinicola]
MGQGNAMEQRKALAEAIADARSGDPAATERAAGLFQETDYYGLVEHYLAYAGLGERQRDQAASRLAAHAQSCQFAPRTATRMLNALADLGPDQAPKLHQALAHLQQRWAGAPLARTCLGVFRRPLADVGAAFAPHVAGEALRSLRVDPDRFLPHRTDGFVMRREERVVVELAAGTTEQREQLAAALVELTHNQDLSPLQRHRAVSAMEHLDAAAGRDCAARLRAAGIEDPGDPMPDSVVVARVDAAWQRIEDAMRERSPHLLGELGPPLRPQDVAVCRQILGVPDAFAACLARHRYARLFPHELSYEDVRGMLGQVDEEWWQDDGDWGDLPELADDAAWLDRLHAYAEYLDSGGA